ncbi:MAG TPA: hypothetical protein VGS21_03785 [Acidimicrobiales bacterium]|nr:hypothetical protein [Acidimicrobiales bacterium]
MTATGSTRSMSPIGASRVVEDDLVSREIRRTVWSPAQAIALLAGVVLLVLGGVALAHTGLKFSDIPATRWSVVAMPITSLGAVVELAAGAVALASAAYAASAKAILAVLGVLILAFGLLVTADSTAFVNMWGYTRVNGIFYIVVGGVMFASAVVSPILVRRRYVRTHDRSAFDLQA